MTNKSFIMKKIIFSLAGIYLTLILFNSCVSVESLAKTVTVESGQIPPDMKTETFVLIGMLIEKSGYDRGLEKGFANYTGNYILATDKEIKDKYDDINKFRYIMASKLERSVYTNSTGALTSSYGYRFYILDRKENKEYLRTTRSSFISSEVKAYLIAIEAIRKK